MGECRHQVRLAACPSQSFSALGAGPPVSSSPLLVWSFLLPSLLAASFSLNLLSLAIAAAGVAVRSRRADFDGDFGSTTEGGHDVLEEAEEHQQRQVVGEETACLPVGADHDGEQPWAGLPDCGCDV